MQKAARFLSYFSKETLSKMTSLRFLPNTVSDFSDAEGQSVQVPVEYLKRSINHILENINEHFKPTTKNASDGLYLGTAGVSYMYYYLSKIAALMEDQKKLLKLSREYLKPSLVIAKRDADKICDAPSFMLGNCGIYAVAAAVYNAMGDHSESLRYFEMYKKAAQTCKERFLTCGSDELFVGRAGYILGSLWLSKELKQEVDKKNLYDICKVMIKSGRDYAATHKSPCPLMYSYYKVEYFGAAHGLSSILQAIISVPGYLADNPDDAKDVKDSVDYLLSLQDREGNFPCESSELGSQQNELVHWCHGAPGIIYLMAKAYLVWREEKYVKSCLLTGDVVWEKGLLKKGPGICHGVAGNGYVFLLLYRLTGNPKFLHRSIAFAQFMDNDAFKRKARTPDNPQTLYEGVAGTACYLADIMAPKQAAFPFSDVFI